MRVRVNRAMSGVWPFVCVAVGFLAGATGCTHDNHSATDRKPATTGQVDMARVQAIDRAKAELTKQGRDARAYDMKVRETPSEWEVAFYQKPPRPPGGTLSIYVSKRDGSVRTMLGR